MTTRISILAAFFLLAVPGAGAETEPAVPAIVERAIALHGGERYGAMESSFEIASRSGTFRVEVRRDGGLFRDTVEARTDAGLRRVTSANDGVSITLDGEPVPVPADEEQRFRDYVSARVWFPLLPYGLVADSIRLHDQGLERWPVTDGSEGADGREATRELHKVKVTFAAGTSTDSDDEYLVWFDPESGRMEQLVYSFDGGLRFRRATNYRRVGGILFSDQVNLGIDEEGRSVDEITPALVAGEMRPISTVEIRDIEVRPLD